MTLPAQPARPLEWLRSLPPPSKELPRAQRDVLIQLALAMSADGSGWVPEARLAVEAGCSTDTVQRVVKWARLAGWLARTERGHRVTSERARASAYQLLKPAPNTAPNAVLASDPTPQTGEPTPQNTRANTAPNAALRGPSQEVLSKRSSLSGPGLRERLSEAAGQEVSEREFQDFTNKLRDDGARSPAAIIGARIKDGTAAELVEELRVDDEDYPDMTASWQAPYRDQGTWDSDIEERGMFR